MLIKENIFFENNEGKKHYKAKMKLLDIIINNSKSISDHEKTYSIFQGDYKDEFLHIESFLFTIGDGYKNIAMYSNETLPCIEYLNLNTDCKSLCNFKGGFGLVESLPCRRCLELNKSNLPSKLKIGFTPDIAYGYNGRHKIWIEIVDTNECSYYKRKFCFDNGITLLEVDCKSIDKYKDKIIFNNLSKSDIQKETINEFLSDIYKEIEIKGYAGKVEFRNTLMQLMYPISNEEFDKLYYKILNDNKWWELKQRNEEINRIYNLPEGEYHLIVSASLFLSISKSYETIALNKLKADLKELTSLILNDIDEYGFSISKKHKPIILRRLDSLNNRLRANYKWDGYLKDNGLMELEKYNKEKYNVDTVGYPFIIIRNEN